MREAFWRFYTFSKEQPEYFSLIFVDSAVPRISRDWERFSSMRELRQDVEQDIQQCIDEGLFPGVDAPASIFRILWTAVYGAAVFRLSHRLAPGEDADALVHELLACVIAGLRSGIALRFAVTSDTRETLEATQLRPSARSRGSPCKHIPRARTSGPSCRSRGAATPSSRGPGIEGFC